MTEMIFDLYSWFCEATRAEPNQALEPTRLGVTPAADAPVAPPSRVAQLER